MIPESFRTLRGDRPASHPIVVRGDVDVAAARPLLRRLAEVEWESLDHAYGAAGDVPGQLAAITVGDDATRAEAWWNLWGNIHHQGDIYPATLPAVPVLIALGNWRDYPDRAETIVLLREIARAEGVTNGTHDDFAALREAIAGGTRHLTARWRTEPPPVRRALLWLLSAVPEVRVDHHDLVVATLPENHRRAWDSVLAGDPASQEDFDAVVALEEWVEGSG
jgi:hypothetical protein